MNIFDTSNPANWEDQYSQQSSGTINRIATLQPEAKLPDWLTTNPDDLIKELHSTYGRIPSLVNGANIGKAYDDAISTTRGMGGQIANNAATEAVTRGGITGGQVNSAMVKAQSMLPVYDTTNKLQTDKALAVAEQQKSQAALMSQVASTMGSLRTNYLASLGALHNQRQQSASSWTMGQQQMGQSALQQQRAYDMSMAELAKRSSAATGATTRAGATTLGYIPNSGPVIEAMVNGVRQNNTASVGFSENANFGWAPQPRKAANPLQYY